jgi:hypothetical protein
VVLRVGGTSSVVRVLGQERFVHILSGSGSKLSQLQYMRGIWTKYSIQLSHSAAGKVGVNAAQERWQTPLCHLTHAQGS